jgi:hypothetical protein
MTTTATLPARGGTRRLELALPIPDDRDRRTHAIDYLYDCIEHYLDAYGAEDSEAGRRLRGRLAAVPRRTLKEEGISLTQAIQVFLCFFILMLGF